MKIKKFEAQTLKDAMEQARKELGEEAVILNTREFTLAEPAGKGAQTVVELVAAVDESDAALAQALQAPRPISSTPVTGEAPGDLTNEVAALRNAFESLVGEGILAAHVRPDSMAERRLRDAGVEPAIASQIAKSLRSGKPVEQLAQQWACLFTCAELPMQEYGPSIFAMVGPTGSGKTTTLAKLAAEFKFKKHKTVAIIGCDTQRIGASEGLKTMALALGVDYHQAITAKELTLNINLLADYDVILIDTAGGPGHKKEYIEGLKGLLQDGRIQSVIVLPSNLSSETRQHALKSFEILDPARVIISKLDETPGLGPIVSICQETRAAVSHVTNNQTAPGGIQQTTSQGLALLVFSSLMNES